MTTVEVIAEGLSFPEGPVVMADGSVLVVESTRESHPLLGRRAHRDGFHPRRRAQWPRHRPGRRTLCVQQRRAAPHGSDRLPEPGRIERIDLATGKVERVYEACDGQALSAPNDLMFDCDGNMWFTDLGKIFTQTKEFGGLYCARADGSAITRIQGGTLSYNGVGVSPDWSTVYVADTYSARVYAYERRIAAQEPRLVATVPGMVLIDSLAMAASGNVCVATVFEGGVTTVTPAGEVTKHPLGDRLVTNVAFGGPDMMDAYVTYSGCGALVRTRWHEPGMRLVYNA